MALPILFYFTLKQRFQSKDNLLLVLISSIIFLSPYYRTSSYWGLTELRLKKFRPNYCFTDWHSEHCITSPLRMMNVQIYLTTHKSGTEFFDGEVIQSKKGRLTFFPSYFTHTHRGMPSFKTEKEILTGWYSYIMAGDSLRWD